MYIHRKKNELFGRGEKPLKPEEYYKEEPYKMEDSYYLEDAMNRLGILEDLMQEYNINSIQELEILINSHKKQEEKIIDLSADLGFFQNENINLTKDIEKYWNIEEELGCPLEAMIKALKDGFKAFDYYDNSVCSHAGGDLSYCDRKGFYFDWKTASDSSKKVYLKDYQKTWWLKGEKDEACNGTD